MPSTRESYPQRDATFRVINGAVVVNDRYRPRIVALDELGCQIWLRIDGLTTVADIAADIVGQTGEPAAQVETRTIALTGVLLSEGLLYLASEPTPQPYHVAISQDHQDPIEAQISMRAAGWVESPQPDDE